MSVKYEIGDHHPASQQVLRFFSYDHLPEGALREASRRFYETAVGALRSTPPGPEVTVDLRKLLEAKDCFVRACLG